MKNKTKTHQLNLRMSSEDMELFNTLAAFLGIKVSAMIRLVVMAEYRRCAEEKKEK